MLKEPSSIVSTASGVLPVSKLRKIQNCRCGGTADALVSGSSEEIRVGSNPVIRTKQKDRVNVALSFCFFGGGDGNAEPTCEPRAEVGDVCCCKLVGFRKANILFKIPSSRLPGCLCIV